MLSLSCSAWVPGRVGSAAVVFRLSCPIACGILVPGPGIEPTSPALEGRFLTTTRPPGKSQTIFFFFFFKNKVGGISLDSFKT